MWDAVTYVDRTPGPIIAEGRPPARLVILNAGPMSVAVKGWNTTRPGREEEADIFLQVWPGNTVSVAAELVRVELLEDAPRHPTGAASGSFAAIAWRVVS